MKDNYQSLYVLDKSFMCKLKYGIAAPNGRLTKALNRVDSDENERGESCYWLADY